MINSNTVLVTVAAMTVGYAKEFKEKKMMKKFNKILNIIMGSSIGVFLGHFLYNFVDYKENKLLYEIQSAPWYTSSIIYGLVMIFVITTVIIIKIVLSIVVKRKYTVLTNKAKRK